MGDIPAYLHEFTDKKRAAFQAWLDARGGNRLGPTNEFEVMRFTTRDGIGVIYRNNAGRLRWTSAAEEAWKAHCAGASHDEYRIVERGERIKGGSRRRQLVAALVQRDGTTCACCGLSMPTEDRTIEHFVPVALGGSKAAHNLILVHEACNQKLADMNIRAKIEFIALARAGASVQHNSRVCNAETERDDEHYGVASRPLTPAGA